jgi:dipeptide/tripeptide permease
MMAPELLGGLVVGIPALLVAYLALWRRRRPVFWFALALIVVGVGYLAATGALADIGSFLLSETPMPVEMPAP